jgi:hypothetical protein
MTILIFLTCARTFNPSATVERSMLTKFDRMRLTNKAHIFALGEENCYRCNATVEVALNQPFRCEGFQSNRINTEAPQKQRQTG